MIPEIISVGEQRLTGAETGSFWSGVSAVWTETQTGGDRSEAQLRLEVEKDARSVSVTEEEEVMVLSEELPGKGG